MSAIHWPGTHGKAVFYGVGLCAAFATVLALGEGYARLRLPSDIGQQLGENPVHKGIYKPDPVLGVDYRSYEDFYAENIQRLSELGSLESYRRILVTEGIRRQRLELAV
jgi:hypothetical protein